MPEGDDPVNRMNAEAANIGWNYEKRYIQTRETEREETRRAMMKVNDGELEQANEIVYLSCVLNPYSKSPSVNLIPLLANCV